MKVYQWLYISHSRYDVNSPVKKKAKLRFVDIDETRYLQYNEIIIISYL